MTFDYRRILTNAPRVLIGVVFVISSVGKFIEREDAKNLVKIIFEKINVSLNLGNEIVVLTIITELILAFLLFFKKKLFLSYSISFLFVATFTVALGLLYHDGVTLSSCGCFGAFRFSGGLQTTLIRNTILMCLIAIGYVVYLKNDQKLNRDISQ